MLARRKASDAARMRGSWLVAVAHEKATWQELVIAATDEAGKPLLKVRLDDLMCAHLDLRTSARNMAIARLRAYAGVNGDVPDRKITVGWMLRNNMRNPHTAAARISYLVDVMSPISMRTDRVPGYPFQLTDDLRGAWS